MGLLQKLTAGLSVPFPGVRWNPETGKVLSTTEAFRTLDADLQEKALALPAWDFLIENGQVFSKHIIERSESEETFFLLPAEGYYETIQKVKELEKENAFLRDQLHAFVQQIPVPLFVIEEGRQTHRITYANQLLLELAGIPLAQLYKGLTLEDVFPDHPEAVEALLQKAQQSRKPVQAVLEGHRKSGQLYAYLVRAFSFETPSLKGIFFAIIDISKEKEQEIQLEQQNQELLVLTEELRQNQEELQMSLQELSAARAVAETRQKELEDSLEAAKRYQRNLLLRPKNIIDNWGRDRVAMVSKVHSYVGGDFLLGLCHQDFFYVAVGDATGHGPSGALLALTVQNELRYRLTRLQHPRQLHTLLEGTREVLFELFDVKPDVTLSNEGAEVGIIALPLARERAFYYAGAGRTLYNLKPDGDLEEIAGTRHGIGWNVPGTPPESYQTLELSYSSGSTLFLFTDGVSDQHNLSGKKIGRKRLRQWIQDSAQAGPTPVDKTRYIMKQWLSFSGGAPQTDDVLLLAIEL